MTVVALSAAPDGDAVMVELPDSVDDQLRALCRLIGCAAAEAIVVGPDLLIWLDDNHIDPVAWLNPGASTLAASVTGRADIQGVAVSLARPTSMVISSRCQPGGGILSSGLGPWRRRTPPPVSDRN